MIWRHEYRSLDLSDLAKITLALVLFIAAFVGMVVVGGAHWLNDVREEAQAERPLIQAEARAFAEGGSGGACVDEALLRTDECDGLMCQVKVQEFLGVCLAEADPSPGFCEAVPSSSGVMASARWAVEQCTDRGSPERACTRVFRTVQNFCDAP